MQIERSDDVLYLKEKLYRPLFLWTVRLLPSISIQGVKSYLNFHKKQYYKSKSDLRFSTSSNLATEILEKAAKYAQNCYHWTSGSFR